MQLFKRIYGSGTTALVIPNKEIEDIVKTVKSGLLINKAIKNKRIEQGLFQYILGTLAASMLRSALTGGVIRVGEGIIRTGGNF